MLDNEKEESNKGIKIGSIKDRLTNFLENGERKNVKSLDESVFVGVSDVMSKFRIVTMKISSVVLSSQVFRRECDQQRTVLLGYW